MCTYLINYYLFSYKKNLIKNLILPNEDDKIHNIYYIYFMSLYILLISTKGKRNHFWVLHFTINYIFKLLTSKTNFLSYDHLNNSIIICIS